MELLCESYNLYESFILKHLNNISKNLDTLSTKYDNAHSMGDLNV